MSSHYMNTRMQECTCSCHHMGARHIVACCEECSTCGTRIKTGSIDQHVVPCRLTHNPNMEVTLVTSDDWEGIYLDGRLVSESHSHRTQEALRALGVEVQIVEADLEWIESVGHLPADLAKVRRSGT